MREVRPDISEVSDADTFERWYWLSAALVRKARQLGLSTSGNKQVLRDRVLTYLRDGRVLEASVTVPPVSKDDFDWARAPLLASTRITSGISFGPNLRRFFRDYLGCKVTFSIDFMAWVRANPGRTLAEAADVYRSLQLRDKSPGYQREIAQDNQFNQYTRDCTDANPGIFHATVRKLWLLRRSLPAPGGRIRYSAADLDLLKTP